MRFIDEQSLERLGLKTIINRIEPLSPYGKELHKSIILSPFKDRDELEGEFSRLESIILYIQEFPKEIKTIKMLLHSMKNLSRLLELIAPDYILEDVDLFELKLLCITMEKLRGVINFSCDSLQRFHLKPMDKFIDILDPKKDRVPTFHIYSEYSEELSSIRESKKSIEEKIYLEKNPDIKEGLLEERLHIVLEESRVESIIRGELLMEILPHIKDYRENISKIGELDLLISKGEFSIRYGGVRPTLSNSNKIVGRGLVNLEVRDLLEKKGGTFTKLDISLKIGSNIITGANMGGKSVALKTLCENIALVHFGIFPIGDYIESPILDFIYFVSDDMQDLSKGLSTFGAEIKKLQEISIFLKHGVGLVVFDEFARGTNPEEGRRFVKALATYLNSENSFSLLTTHFDGIATKEMNHYQVIGLKNIDFEKLNHLMGLNRYSLDILQEYMDYRLVLSEDYIVPKYAYNIATLLGVNEDFLEYLKEEYKGEF